MDDDCNALNCPAKARLWRRDSNGYVIEGFCFSHAVEFTEAATKTIVFKDKDDKVIIEATPVYHYKRLGT